MVEAGAMEAGAAAIRMRWRATRGRWNATLQATDVGSDHEVTNGVWQEPSISETSVGMVLSYRLPNATDPCRAVQSNDVTSFQIIQTYGGTGAMGCGDIAIARNASRSGKTPMIVGDVPVAIWLDNNELFAERLCL